ncbi:UNVERIFIED_ORG: tRNA pseudouridine55 synthase [Xanthobacter viscosus]|uniref:tRNA pseudouridine synthase B n=1 Tax=Xanthobacter autotrophicus TaxID=280 RepID=A0A6C1KD20_XANAU|nr:tRNA pseudouridine(55) synthase TruB [Xanthobacter autotrophicus]TLX42080.1 tRNA pseudouridine(55) synthase TruB [Xanthobacter autotrophicus]
MTAPFAADAAAPILAAEAELPPAPVAADATAAQTLPDGAEPPRASREQDNRPRAPKRDLDGWVLLDKPTGMTSTQAVAVVKRIFGARKAGHAGTLDPLASGCLPIAFGEATKTVPYVMDGRKTYRFTVRFGVETDTDDSEGKAVVTSDHRPTDADIVAALAAFRGEIMQVPPAYSALKIGGERAYDLAREGEEVVLQPRPVTIFRIELVERPDADHAVLEAECGKGTYVRAIARDLGRMLDARGHVSALRRACVGPFLEEDLVPLDEMRERAETSEEALMDALDPVALALEEIPQIAVTPPDAHRLRCGQSVILRGRDAPIVQGHAAITCQGALIAIGDVDAGEIFPHRVFNWGQKDKKPQRRGKR